MTTVFLPSGAGGFTRTPTPAGSFGKPESCRTTTVPVPVVSRAGALGDAAMTDTFDEDAIAADAAAAAAQEAEYARHCEAQYNAYCNEQMAAQADDPLSITRYAIHTEMAPADVAERLSRLNACMERAKELKAAFEADLTEWLKIHGTLDDGREFWWLGHKSETKCVDVPGAMMALLDASFGDADALCRNFLAAQPIKHGAARQALPPDVFERCFRTEKKDTLENGEKLPKRLQHCAKEYVSAASPPR